MAAIVCGECGGTVSTTAKQCPHCGAKPYRFKRNTVTPIKVMVWFSLAFILIGILVPKSEKKSANVSAESSALGVADKSRLLDRTTEDKLKVCKAAISYIFNRPTNIIQVSPRYEFIDASYIRPEDKEKFDYTCDINGNSVMWAANVDGKWGRWRDHADDGKIFYEFDNTTLTIREEVKGETVAKKKYIFKDI